LYNRFCNKRLPHPAAAGFAMTVSGAYVVKNHTLITAFSWACGLSAQGGLDALAGALQPPKVARNPTLIVVASAFSVTLSFCQ